MPTLIGIFTCECLSIGISTCNIVILFKLHRQVGKQDGERRKRNKELGERVAREGQHYMRASVQADGGLCIEVPMVDGTLSLCITFRTFVQG